MNQLNYDKLISHSRDTHLSLNFWVSFVSKYLLHGFHSFQGLLPVPSNLCHSFQQTCIMHANLNHMKPIRNKILRLLQVPIQEQHKVLFQKVPMQLIVGWCCLWQWIQNKYQGNNSTQCYCAVSNSSIWGPLLKLYLHEDATFLTLINLLPSQQKSYTADHLMRVILYIGVA